MKAKEIAKDQALRRLVRTQERSRVMRPLYGMNWNQYIDVPESTALYAEILEKMDRFLPGIEIIHFKKGTEKGTEKGRRTLFIETADRGEISIQTE